MTDILKQIRDVAETINHPRSRKDVALKVCEEAGEVAQAVAKKMPKHKIVEECVDTIVAAVDMIHITTKGKISNEEISALIDIKMKKWVTKYGITE